VKATTRATRHRNSHGRRRLLTFGGGGLAILVAVALATFLSTSILPHHTADVAAASTSTRSATPTADTGSGNANQIAVSPKAKSPTPTPTPHTTTAAASTTSASSHPSATVSSATAPASASLAGLIEPDVTYKGIATEYSAGDGDGACSFGPAANMMIAAMNYTDYDNSKACGAYVLVHASDGASITVLITNECPAPCAPGQLDLSQQAFAKLANPTAGLIPITWQLLSPNLSNDISIRYKTGSSQYWCGIQVIGHRNPVALLEVDTSSGWQQLPRTGYNYFLSANGSGCGDAIRVTDIYGQQLTVAGLAVSPNVVQPTTVQFALH
jgi:expansin (peptidoglycan-binding protein)